MASVAGGGGGGSGAPEKRARVELKSRVPARRPLPALPRQVRAARRDMASPSRQAPAGGPGLLRGSRARSYGSLVHTACSPVRERRLEHPLAPGDTLAGLALRYGVTVSVGGSGMPRGGSAFVGAKAWRHLSRRHVLAPGPVTRPAAAPGTPIH